MSDVKVGKATVGGTGIAVVGLIMAVFAFIDGKHDEATIGAIVLGIGAVPTIIGRMVQAYGQIRAQAEAARGVPELAGVATSLAQHGERLEALEALKPALDALVQQPNTSNPHSSGANIIVPVHMAFGGGITIKANEPVQTEPGHDVLEGEPEQQPVSDEQVNRERGAVSPVVASAPEHEQRDLHDGGQS